MKGSTSLVIVAVIAVAAYFYFAAAASACMCAPGSSQPNYLTLMAKCYDKTQAASKIPFQ